MKLKNAILSVFLLTAMVMLTACNTNAAATPAVVSTEIPTSDLALEENEVDDSASGVEETARSIPLIFSHDGAMDDIATILYLHRIPQINQL